MAKILIIEDYPSLQKLYKDALAAAGHRVVVARDSSTAHEEASKLRPDLILLDLLMPEVSGFEFLKSYDHSNTEVIILSNLSSPALAKEAKSLGVSSYLLKSKLTPKQVVLEVEKTLDRTKNDGSNTAS